MEQKLGVPIRRQVARAIADEAIEAAKMKLKELSTAIETGKLGADITLLHDYVRGKIRVTDANADKLVPKLHHALHRLMRLVALPTIHHKDERLPNRVPEGGYVVTELIRAATGRLLLDDGHPIPPRYFSALTGMHQSTVSKQRKLNRIPGDVSGINGAFAVRYLAELEAAENELAEALTEVKANHR